MSKLISENAARQKLFSSDSRPSLPAFQRLRREHSLPHILIGRRIAYDIKELEEFLIQNHHSPSIK